MPGAKIGVLGYNGAGNFPLMYFDSGMYFGGANYQNGWNFSPVGSQYNDYYAGNLGLANARETSHQLLGVAR